MWWEVDGGKADNHMVFFDGKTWWGYENILPRSHHQELFVALQSGATEWRNFTIRRVIDRAD